MLVSVFGNSCAETTRNSILTSPLSITVPEEMTVTNRGVELTIDEANQMDQQEVTPHRF